MLDISNVYRNDINGRYVLLSRIVYRDVCRFNGDSHSEGVFTGACLTDLISVQIQIQFTYTFNFFIAGGRIVYSLRLKIFPTWSMLLTVVIISVLFYLREI